MNFEKYLNESYALYLYGSRVYGTASFNSDWDYIVIGDQYRDGELSISSADYKFFTPAKFQALINDHNISALECLWLSEEQILKSPEKPWSFDLDRVALRHSISSKASHSWGKAKKKFSNPYAWAKDENLRGKKSLFHSLRIISFGIQIAKDKAITDYSCCNDFYEEIINEPSENWESYRNKWKPVYNNLMTEFRKLAPEK